MSRIAFDGYGEPVGPYAIDKRHESGAGHSIKLMRSKYSSTLMPTRSCADCVLSTPRTAPPDCAGDEVWATFTAGRSGADDVPAGAVVSCERQPNSNRHATRNTPGRNIRWSVLAARRQASQRRHRCSRMGRPRGKCGLDSDEHAQLRHRERQPRPVSVPPPVTRCVPSEANPFG